MKGILRITAIVFSGILVTGLTRCQMSRKPSEEEKTAYRQWAQARTLGPVAQWMEELAAQGLLPQDPCEAVPVASADAVVLQPGESYTTTIPVKLPVEYVRDDGDVSMFDHHFSGDPDFWVSRNEWGDAGVRVTVRPGTVTPYQFDAWRLVKNGSRSILRAGDPVLSAEETGRLSRREIADLRARGMRFEPAVDFDPDFDLEQAKGLSHRADLTYTVEVPDDLDLGPDAPCRWGMVLLKGREHEGRYGFLLTHRKGEQGLILQSPNL
jgi:hypothetical protein